MEAPKRKMPKTAMDEPILDTCLTDKEDPTLVNSMTANAAPKRPKVRIDRELPKFV
jgi:hypothetical protein